MPSNNQFLEAIAADSDDLVPRLIYADWLDEQGDPRGEFIRVQCELADLTPGTARFKALSARAKELLPELKSHWFPEGFDGLRTHFHRFHNGFPDTFEHNRSDRVIVRDATRYLEDPAFPVHTIIFARSSYRADRLIDSIHQLREDLEGCNRRGKPVPGLWLNELSYPGFYSDDRELQILIDESQRIATAIAEMLPRNLRYLHARNMALGFSQPHCESLHLLCDNLPQTLRMVDFSQNALAAQNGAENLRYFLKQLPPTLERLKLAANNIGEGENGYREIHELASHLPRQLKELDLSGNDLTLGADPELDFDETIARIHLNSVTERLAVLTQALPESLEILNMKDCLPLSTEEWRKNFSFFTIVPLIHLRSLTLEDYSEKELDETRQQACLDDLSISYWQTIHSHGKRPSMVNLEVLNGIELEGEIAELRNKARKVYEKCHPGVFKEKPDTPGPDEPPAYPSLATADEDEDDTPDRPTPEPRVTSDDIWRERSQQAKGGGK